MSKRKRVTVGPPTSAGFYANEAPEVPAPVQPDAPEVSHYDFASDEASEAWIIAGMPVLTDPPAGKNGYTVADMKAAYTPKEL